MSKTLAQKLLEVQKEVGAVSKDSENPFYNSKYFDINKLLEVVKPVLSKHGVVLMQPLTSDAEGKITLTTMLMNSDDAQDNLAFTTPITQMNDAQKTGASVTYFRRYALQSILGLQAEDDDGNSLVKKPAGRKPAAKSKKSTGVPW